MIFICTLHLVKLLGDFGFFNATMILALTQAGATRRPAPLLCVESAT